MSRGRSPFLVWDGRRRSSRMAKSFWTTAVPCHGGLSLLCALAVDAKSGRIVWDREVCAVEKSPEIHSKNSHASPTPIVWKVRCTFISEHWEWRVWSPLMALCNGRTTS